MEDKTGFSENFLQNIFSSSYDQFILQYTCFNIFRKYIRILFETTYTQVHQRVVGYISRALPFALYDSRFIRFYLIAKIVYDIRDTKQKIYS